MNASISKLIGHCHYKVLNDQPLKCLYWDGLRLSRILGDTLNYIELVNLMKDTRVAVRVFKWISKRLEHIVNAGGFIWVWFKVRVWWLVYVWGCADRGTVCKWVFTVSLLVEEVLKLILELQHAMAKYPSQGNGHTL